MITVYSQRNRRLLEEHKKMLIGYLAAGYPDDASFLEVLQESCTAGIDVIEIGYPAQNPEFDGDVIRKAHELVDRTVVLSPAYWQKIRTHCSVPIWVMGYSEDILDSGAYIELAKKGLIDAFIVPDMGLKRSISLRQELAPYEVDVVCFLPKNSSEADRVLCFKNFSMVYYQLVDGPTGSGSQMSSTDYASIIQSANGYPHLHLFGGFGVDTAKKARQVIDEGFAAVIMGTIMIKQLNESPQKLYSFIQEVKEAIRS